MEQSAPFRHSVTMSLYLLRTSRVDGIIYIGVYHRDVGNILPALDIPVVYTYAYTQNKDYCINYDDYQGAYIAVEHMVKMGHKKKP